MTDGITFGEYITEKRKQAKYSMRQFAKAISLSPSYLCNVEHGARPAPSYDILQIMARVLELNNEERLKLFDLAAKTKQRNTIPHDVFEYIVNDNNVCAFLRIAIENKLDGKQLMRLINS